MKKILLLIILMGIRTNCSESADVGVVSTFLDNLKYFVVRLMTSSKAAEQSKNAFINLNPHLQALMSQGKVQLAASKPQEKPKSTALSLSDNLKNVLAVFKPTTDVLVGSYKIDNGEYKLQPGLITALLKMITLLPKIIPATTGFQSIKDGLGEVAPTIQKINMQANTWALRLTYVYNMITSLQQLCASFNGRAMPESFSNSRLPIDRTRLK